MNWQLYPLANIAAPGRGTFSNGPFGSDLVKAELVDVGVPVIYIRDIRTTKYERISTNCVTQRKADALPNCHVEPGDILIAKVGNPPGLACVYPEAEPPAIVTQDVIRLRPNLACANPNFVCAWLNSPAGRHVIKTITVEATRARFALGSLKKLQIPLPPLAEQKRIAAILDKADAVRRKRQEAIRLTEEFLRSGFLEMFGDPVTNPMGWEERPLEELADIRSGVTKGRKLGNKPTVSVPYMRVANVQDGRILLGDVKEIEVLPADVERYSLREGDLLLTEGGDPDKLGRGAVWGGEIAPCIHQNHIFCVRSNADVILSEYLSSLIGSQRGKRYFLRSAKQTTGIATINKTQLRGFPALVPRLDVQRAYSELVDRVRLSRLSQVERHKYTDDLFGSLVQHAFRGEL